MKYMYVYLSKLPKILHVYRASRLYGGLGYIMYKVAKKDMTRSFISLLALTVSPHYYP